MYFKYKQSVKNLFKRQMEVTNVNQTWKVKIYLKIIIKYCKKQQNTLFCHYVIYFVTEAAVHLNISFILTKFLENDMIDGLYWETLYNVGYKKAPGLKIQPLNCPYTDIPATQPCPVDPANRNVMYENRMLGFPRLRMVNVWSSIKCQTIII